MVKKSSRPPATLPNNIRRAAAAFLQSKLPGIEFSWRTGHGAAMTGKRIFAFITRTGDLAMKLPQERMDELEGLGEGRRLKMGQRVLREWFVSPVAESTGPDTLDLLREARSFVESVPEKPKKAAKKSTK